jgi:large subunit ribosomal protein L1
MGKIRVKTLGIDEIEKQEKEEAKKRQEDKKHEEQSAGRRMEKAPGMKGGERVVSVGPSEEELAKLEELEKEKAEEKEPIGQSPLGGAKKEKKAKFVKAPRSKKYQGLVVSFDKNKTYSLSEGLDLLEKLQRGSFDETVELHVNTISAGISGNITLPHGTGKKTRVVIADDKIIAEVEKGIINFDILVAHPSIMPKLAKVARVLGPKGIMPNPKNGTITDKPEELVKKYEGGQISYRTELKAPLLHLSVGKMSFGKTKLTDNIKALVSAIKKENIQKITLKSSMSPGIKILV